MSSQHKRLKVSKQKAARSAAVCTDESTSHGRARSISRTWRNKETLILTRGREPTKGFKSAISKITHDTFNTGQKKISAQFTQSQKNVANYLQHTLAAEGYLVAETVCTSKKQTIDLPPAINESAPDMDDQRLFEEKRSRRLQREG
jgi:hypothetical protein